MKEAKTMKAYTTGYRNPLSRVFHAITDQTIGHGAGLRHDVPIPEIASNQILIRVHSVAQNPTDWKHADWIGGARTILGCDWAGHVAKIGPEAKGGWTVGDRVGGSCHGGKYEDEGAYAEYLKTEGDLVFKVPESLSFADATSYGASGMTAMMVLYHIMDVPWPDEPQVTGKPEILVYAASTAAGLMSLQMAAHAGYRVAATCSPRNFDLCKKYGATDVYDYNSPTVEEDIKRDYPNVNRALDCVSHTPSLCTRILNSSKNVTPENPGQVIGLFPKGHNDGKMKGNVFVRTVAAYTLGGRPFTMIAITGVKYPAIPEDRAALVRFYKMLPNLLDWLKPLPTEFIEGGFEGIPKGLDMLRQNKVSGKKLVLKLSDE